jgi:UDPglucose 6-dehydrogenase
MKISIVGCGYVGLVSGVCLAEKGHEVICVDIDQAKVDQINRGETPIYEKGLQDLMRRNLAHRFCAATNLVEAVMDTDLSVIAVGTPFDGEEIDLRFVEEAAIQIGRVLKKKSAYHVVVVKSTVVPGTTDDVITPLLEKASGKVAGADFGVAMNPEFLREGEAVHDFMSPDRVILGALDERTLVVLEELYSPFDGVPKLCTNLRTAETIKYTANALLATMISFSNEIGNLCAAIGDVDVVEVMRGVHLDKRISPILNDGTRIKPDFTTYIEAGCGFGGSCFSKDVQALISYGQEKGNPMRILKAVIDLNSAQPRKILSLLRKHYPVLESVKITILGLAFKPGTNDMRESPAIPIVNELLAQRAVIKAYDPAAQEEAKKIFGAESLAFAETLPEAVDDAEVVVILTRWPEFQELPRLFSVLPRQPLLIDGRRMLEKDSVSRYDGIGFSNSEKEAVPVRQKNGWKDRLTLVFMASTQLDSLTSVFDLALFAA